MGACCFTPRRTQFLWWYWLVLATIVGIPMFLAARYVARHPAHDVYEKKKVSKKAFLIFGSASLLSMMLAISLGYFVHRWVHPFAAHRFGTWDSDYPLMAFVQLVIGYVSGLGLAVCLDGVWRKRKSKLLRLVALLGFLLFSVLLFQKTAASMYPTPGQLVMFMVVCMIPAYVWGRFSDSPSTQTARKALVVLILGAFLFWGVAKYGTIANWYCYRLSRGTMPVPEEVADHLDR